MIFCRKFKSDIIVKSNGYPLTKTNFRSIILLFFREQQFHKCGCSSMVEPQPSKLVAWVRFPSPAPISKSKDLDIFLHNL